MPTNNAANMKRVGTKKSENTSAVTKQSVVNVSSWGKQQCTRKPKLNMEESWNMRFKAILSLAKEAHSVVNI